MYVSMKNMLNNANREGYAVMAINCFNIETVRSAAEAACEMRAPIIINIYKDHYLKHFNGKLAVGVVKEIAEKVCIPVALNLDHGTETDYVLKAIDDGFSSVMIDASRYEFEKNVKITAEITEYAHKKGVSVEGEIGSIGTTEGKAFSEKDMYTDPEQAGEFVKRTGIDALAVSIGTSHGVYPHGEIPDFDFERLKKIKSLTGIPLVLHGGSGSGDENIKKSVEYGINKINIGCDFMNSNRDAAAKAIKENPDINYFDLIEISEKESRNTVKYYIKLSGSENKAKCINI